MCLERLAVVHYVIQVQIFMSIIPGGTAVGGLTPTTPVGVENVTCPSNATSISDCPAVSPPMNPRCYGNFSAAGVRCIQGMNIEDKSNS